MFSLAARHYLNPTRCSPPIGKAVPRRSRRVKARQRLAQVENLAPGKTFNVFVRREQQAGTTIYPEPALGAPKATAAYGILSRRRRTGMSALPA